MDGKGRTVLRLEIHNLKQKNGMTFIVHYRPSLFVKNLQMVQLKVNYQHGKNNVFLT